MKEKELFVEVGAGIIVKKSLADTKKIALEQIGKLTEMKIHLNSEMNLLNSEVENLVRKMEKVKD